MSNRRHACPVAGCSKRGSPGSLRMHARSKHPHISDDAYVLMLGTSPSAAGRRRAVRFGVRAVIRSAVIIALVAIIAVGLAYGFSVL